MTGQTAANWKDHGWIRFQEGNYRAAEEAFSRAIQRDAADATAYYNRALSRYRLQDLAGAHADLTRFLALKPDSVPGYALRASVDLQRGNAVAAIADADAALQLSPEDLDATLVRGNARFQLGQFAEAIADFSHLLTAQPDHLEALLGRGSAALASGDAVLARKDFLAAARQSPREPEIAFQLGQAHLRLLEFSAAAGQFETASRLAPDSALAARSLGYAWFGAGDLARAAQAFERARDLAPEASPFPHLMLHLIALRRGETRPPVAAAALTWPEDWPRLLGRFLQGDLTETELLQHARTMAPAHEQDLRLCEAYFYAGVVRSSRGDVAAARVSFRRAVETNQARLIEHTLARAELARLK